MGGESGLRVCDGDRLAADLIERARTGRPLQAEKTDRRLLETTEARRTLALVPENCNPLDVEYASQVDRFDFAMEVTTDDFGTKIQAR